MATDLKLNESQPNKAAIRLGAWLKARREELGRTLREAAEHGGCSDPWLSQLETGHASLASIRVDNLNKIAKAYDLEMVTLLEKLRILQPSEK